MRLLLHGRTSDQQPEVIMIMARVTVAFYEVYKVYIKMFCGTDVCHIIWELAGSHTFCNS